MKTAGKMPGFQDKTSCIYGTYVTNLLSHYSNRAVEIARIEVFTVVKFK
jgi:hypothetical protein